MFTWHWIKGKIFNGSIKEYLIMPKVKIILYGIFIINIKFVFFQVL